MGNSPSSSSPGPPLSWYEHVQSFTSPSVVGPPLRPHEKKPWSPLASEACGCMDAVAQVKPDPDSDPWVAALSNRSNAARRAIISILCAALAASSSDGATFDGLPKELLDACGGRTERRAAMLEIPFMDGKSPIAWMIHNLPDSLVSQETIAREGLPRVLEALLKCCESPSRLLADSIYLRCCERNSNALLGRLQQHEKLKLADEPSWNRVEYKKHSKGGFAVYRFVVEDFFAQMLSDGEANMRFIHAGGMYSFGFSVNTEGCWVPFIRILHCKKTGWFPTRMAILLYTCIDPNNATQIASFQLTKIPLQSGQEHEPSGSFTPLEQCARQFVQADRTLCGEIWVGDSQLL